MSREVRGWNFAELKRRGAGMHNKAATVELVGQAGNFELCDPLHRGTRRDDHGLSADSERVLSLLHSARQRSQLNDAMDTLGALQG